MIAVHSWSRHRRAAWPSPGRLPRRSHPNHVSEEVARPVPGPGRIVVAGKCVAACRRAVLRWARRGKICPLYQEGGARDVRSSSDASGGCFLANLETHCRRPQESGSADPEGVLYPAERLPGPSRALSLSWIVTAPIRGKTIHDNACRLECPGPRVPAMPVMLHRRAATGVKPRLVRNKIL